MIKIYYCASASDAIPAEISEQRMSKILNIKAPSERIGMINTARALSAGLADLGLSEKDMVYGENSSGKPYLPKYPDIHFSISHTKNISIVAFSDNEIGIDCELSARNISPSLICRFFSGSEANAYAAAPLLLWVAKEAEAKWSGDGLYTTRLKRSLPYFDDEISLDGIWIKRLRLGECEVAICASEKQEVEIVYV